MSNFTTPDINNDKVLEFCNFISKNSKPILIEVTPAPNAEYHYCGKNVNKYIREHGGTLEYGWIIWKYYDFYLDAEAHTIWIDNGNRRDVTPHKESVDYILYLPHDDYMLQIEKQYNAYPPNFLYPYTDNSLIREYVSLVNQSKHNYFEIKGNNEVEVEEAIITVFTEKELSRYIEVKRLLNQRWRGCF